MARIHSPLHTCNSTCNNRTLLLLLTTAASLLQLAGCTNEYFNHTNNTFLTGNVGDPSRTTQASMSDVGKNCLVSILNTKGDTKASALTDNYGNFKIVIDDAHPLELNNTYYIEAVKGLDNNDAGVDAIRLRTIARYLGKDSENNAICSSLTGPNLSVGTSTTALSVIASLRHYNNAQVDSLIGKLTAGGSQPLYGYTFDTTGTPMTNTNDYATVTGLVNQLVTNDTDPLAKIQWDPIAGFSIPSQIVMTYLTSLTPNPAASGSTVTIYGGNFSAILTNNVVTINGTTFTPSSGDTTRLVATLPATLPAAPNLILDVGGATLSLTILPPADVNGHLLTPLNTGTPSAGATIGGSLTLQ